MSVDNRTVINDCEATTGWTGDDGTSVDTDAGSFYEGSSALTWQAGSLSEQMSTTQDSVGATTFSLDWSDSTLYMLTKDNLGEGFSTGGIQFVIGDGTDITGYNVGGNDAAGIPLPLFYASYKLDVSVVVTTPGSFTDHAGTEANLDQTVITAIGLGLNHTANAMGPSDNTAMDCYRYIANDSYALTVNGGTSGTPETTTDLVADDVTNGWGMVSNPQGSLFFFFAPTEWGNTTTVAEHAFVVENEQWYWMGDNGGGHAVGTGHFPFRVTANATDAGLFRLTNVVVVCTGTGADLDLTDADIDTLEILGGGSFTGLASCLCPVSGGTSRLVENISFIQCGTVTHGGASMNGSSILDTTVTGVAGSLVYNVASDPNGEMDNMTFVKGAGAHHAVEFGTSAPLTMTLTGMTTSGFHASDGQTTSTFLFPDTGSDKVWSLSIVGGSGNFSYLKARAGDTVTVAVAVGVSIKAQDQATDPIQNVRISMYLSSDDSEILNADSTAAGITSGSFTGTTPASIYWRARKGSSADSPKYIARSGVGTITSDGFDLLVTMQENPNNNA